MHTMLMRLHQGIATSTTVALQSGGQHSWSTKLTDDSP